MGIRFKIHETPRPKGRKGPKLIHARALCDSTVKMDHLCKMICSRSTISSADVKAVLDSFVWAIGFSLESGQHVELEELRNAELKHTKTPKKLTFEEREKRMLDYLERNKRITTPDYAGLNGCSRYRATADLKLFTEKNVVSKIGGGTHVMYVLTADNK